MPCPTIVLVDGVEPLREHLVSALVARAIVTTPQEQCPASHVAVVSIAGRLAVTITDTVGHVTERQVADVPTAASLVESWARVDLDGPLLEARHPVVAAAAADEMPPVLLQEAARASTNRPLHLTFDAGSAVGSDRSLWVGGAAHACVRLGATCAGVTFRVSQDTAVSGDSETLQTARRAVDLGIVLDVPRVHDGWSWTPGVTLGLAFSRSRYAPESGPAMQVIEVDGGALRAGAHVGLARYIGHRLALGVDVAIDASVFSPTDARDDNAARLAGAPRSFLRGGLELRYEGL